MNLAKLFLIIKIALIAVAVVLLCFLLAQKFVQAPVLVYFVDLSEKESFVEGPFPIERTATVDCGFDKCKAVVFEPVYFNVYAPRKFTRAEVTIKYLLPRNLSASFGVKLNNGDYSFLLLPFNAGTGDFQQQKFEIDLKDAQYLKNKLQFIVSGPEINASHEKMQLENLEIKLIK